MKTFVLCSCCGKQVSNEVEAEELVVRAFVSCPECIEKMDKDEGEEEGLRLCYSEGDIREWLVKNKFWTKEQDEQISFLARHIQILSDAGYFLGRESKRKNGR